MRLKFRRSLWPQPSCCVFARTQPSGKYWEDSDTIRYVSLNFRKPVSLMMASVNGENRHDEWETGTIKSKEIG
jgi:hypothetical protein